MASHSDTYVLGIVGTRRAWYYGGFRKIVDAFIKERGVPSLIVSGGQVGVDKFAERYAEENEIPFREYPAEKNSTPYFHARNQKIVNDSDVLLALPDDASTGTHDTIARAHKKGIDVVVVEIDTTIHA